MSETKVTRRPRGEDAIYFDAAKNWYVGSVSLGYGADGKRIRCKVSGRTKQEVRDRLKGLHQEMDAGVRSLAAWRCSPFFTDRERSALALAEAITLVADTAVPR